MSDKRSKKKQLQNRKQSPKRKLHKKYVVRRVSLLLMAFACLVAAAWFGVKTVVTFAMSKDLAMVSSAENSVEPTSKVTPIVTVTDKEQGPTLGTSSLDTAAKKVEIRIKKPEAPQEWELVLVSEENQLPEDFSVELERVYENMFLDSRIVNNFKQMIVKAKESGISIEIVKAYVDPADQETEFNEEVSRVMQKGKTAEEAKKMVSKIVSPPWESEHHTGLAVDISSTDCEDMEKFDETTAFNWLNEHASEYGFVLRYAKDKEGLTGVDYKPYHFRYVGVEAANDMATHNQCLEEYIQTKIYGSDRVVYSVSGEETENWEASPEAGDEATRRETEEATSSVPESHTQSDTPSSSQPQKPQSSQAQQVQVSEPKQSQPKQSQPKQSESSAPPPTITLNPDVSSKPKQQDNGEKIDGDIN